MRLAANSLKAVYAIRFYELEEKLVAASSRSEVAGCYVFGKEIDKFGVMELF